MVNLAAGVGEEYAKVAPAVSVEVSGGGSGTGIAALNNGTVDIANASRRVEPRRIGYGKEEHRQGAQEFMVGYNALAVYVHKDNPLDEITMEQLAAVFAEGGKVMKWSEMGVNHACRRR